MNSAFTFACGDRNVRDQGVQFVGRVLVLVTLPGQTYAYPVRHIPEKQRNRYKCKLFDMLLRTSQAGRCAMTPSKCQNILKLSDLRKCRLWNFPN